MEGSWRGRNSPLFGPTAKVFLFKDLLFIAHHDTLGRFRSLRLGNSLAGIKDEWLWDCFGLGFPLTGFERCGVAPTVVLVF
jgi:hypothetical protein